MFSPERRYRPDASRCLDERNYGNNSENDWGNDGNGDRDWPAGVKRWEKGEMLELLIQWAVRKDEEATEGIVEETVQKVLKGLEEEREKRLSKNPATCLRTLDQVASRVAEVEWMSTVKQKFLHLHELEEDCHERLGCGPCLQIESGAKLSLTHPGAKSRSATPVAWGVFRTPPFLTTGRNKEMKNSLIFLIFKRGAVLSHP